MPNISADSTRLVHSLFQEKDDGSRPISALQLIFRRCNHLTFERLNLKWHSRLPLIGNSKGRAYYSAEFAGVWYAVAMWSNPVARLLPQQTWLELRRFAIAPDSPKFTASRMLGWMVRDIQSRFPEAERLISYQDLEAHKGIIYRAAGWQHAKNYISRARRGGIGWGNRPRKGRTNQAVSPRMRWEKNVKSPVRFSIAQSTEIVYKESVISRRFGLLAGSPVATESLDAD